MPINKEIYPESHVKHWDGWGPDGCEVAGRPRRILVGEQFRMGESLFEVLMVQKRMLSQANPDLVCGLVKGTVPADLESYMTGENRDLVLLCADSVLTFLENSKALPEERIEKEFKVNPSLRNPFCNGSQRVFEKI